MDEYMHRTIVSTVSLEKIETFRSQEFMLSEVRLKSNKMYYLRLKLASLGLNSVEL